MNFDNHFFHFFHFGADTVTYALFIYGIIEWVIKPKKENKGNYLMHRFMSYLLRCVLIVFVWTILFGISSFLFTISTIFDRSPNRHDFFNPDYPIPYIMGLIISGGLFLVFAWVSSSIIWNWSIDPLKMFFNSFRSPDNIKMTEPQLEILEANYMGGSKGFDERDFLSKIVKNNSLKVIASNDLFGDPEWGIPKRLIVKWRCGGEPQTEIVPEGKELIISKGEAKILNPSR